METQDTAEVSDTGTLIGGAVPAESGQTAPAAPAAPAETAAPAPVPASVETAQAAQPEGTTEDKAEGEPVKAEGEPAAPEYSDFTLPEGFELDADTDKQFREIAGAAGLSQDDAQKLVDLATSMQAKVTESIPGLLEAEIQQRQNAQSQQWVSEIKAMEGIGGPKFDQSKQAAVAAVEKFCPPELREHLENPTIGNNPAIFAILAKVGQAVSQDTFVTGRAAPSARRAADILYQNT